MSDNACAKCGGGIDRDQETTCTACQYEAITGRSYERDVDIEQKGGPTIGQRIREAMALPRFAR